MGVYRAVKGRIASKERKKVPILLVYDAFWFGTNYIILEKPLYKIKIGKEEYFADIPEELELGDEITILIEKRDGLLGKLIDTLVGKKISILYKGKKLDAVFY